MACIDDGWLALLRSDPVKRLAPACQLQDCSRPTVRAHQQIAGGDLFDVSRGAVEHQDFGAGGVTTRWQHDQRITALPAEVAVDRLDRRGLIGAELDHAAPRFCLGCLRG